MGAKYNDRMQLQLIIKLILLHHNADGKLSRTGPLKLKTIIIACNKYIPADFSFLR